MRLLCKRVPHVGLRERVDLGIHSLVGLMEVFEAGVDLIERRHGPSLQDEQHTLQSKLPVTFGRLRQADTQGARKSCDSSKLAALKSWIEAPVDTELSLLTSQKAHSVSLGEA